MSCENHFWNLLVQIFMKITSTKINWILFFQSFKNLEWLFLKNSLFIWKLDRLFKTILKPKIDDFHTKNKNHPTIVYTHFGIAHYTLWIMLHTFWICKGCYMPELCITRPKACLGQHQNVFSAIHLFFKKMNDAKGNNFLKRKRYKNTTTIRT